MNPEQLWKTTMDPEARTLLQVTLEEGAAAENLFTVLMGSEIEPRRRFIQENAQYVRSLDVQGARFDSNIKRPARAGLFLDGCFIANGSLPDTGAYS